MKKRIAKLLKHPWIYIFCASLLILFILSPLMDNPYSLYPFLPESWYDAWEYFAVFGMEGFLVISTLFLFLLTVALIINNAFSRKVRGWQKTKIVFLHLFLLFVVFLVFISFLGRAREKARRISCFSNLRQIYLALDLYASDNESQLPPDLKILSDTDYLADQRVFRCPSRRRPNSEFSDYIYYGAGQTLEYGMWQKQKFEGKTPFLLAKDRDKNHPGKYCNLLMSNGEIIQQNK